MGAVAELVVHATARVNLIKELTSCRSSDQTNDDPSQALVSSNICVRGPPSGNPFIDGARIFQSRYMSRRKAIIADSPIGLVGRGVKYFLRSVGLAKRTFELCHNRLVPGPYISPEVNRPVSGHVAITRIPKPSHTRPDQKYGPFTRGAFVIRFSVNTKVPRPSRNVRVRIVSQLPLGGYGRASF